MPRNKGSATALPPSRRVLRVYSSQHNAMRHSYPLLALMVVCNARQNSTGQPFKATFMILLKAVIIYLPLA